MMSLLFLASSCKRDQQAPKTEAAPVEKGECDAVDETNLEAVVQCFYAAKRESSQRRFYSKAALEEESAAGKGTPNDQPSARIYSDVRVSKQETVGGHMFAAVSRTLRQRLTDGGASCSVTATRSWVREEGKWRLLGGTAKLKEVTTKRNDTGDYSGAAELAEEWLKLNPLSVDAYRQLGIALHRGARGKAQADVVRAAMSIDSHNSDALFLGILLTSDADVRESFLARLAPDDCSLPTAVFNVAATMLGARRPADALKLLDQYPHQKQHLMRVKVLQAQKRPRDAVALLTPEVGGEVRDQLGSADPAFVAYWSAVLASVVLEGGDKQQAREWIDFGLTRDPSNADLARLLRQTKK